MKTLLCFTTLCLAATGFADQLHNFDQIKSAVTKGKLIRIYVDYTKCSSVSKQSIIPNNAAVYTPNAMVITSEGNIGAQILYFTMQDPRYPSKAVYQYGRYVISSDNFLTLTFTVLNAADYTPLEGNSSLHCKIDDGANIYSWRRGNSLH